MKKLFFCLCFISVFFSFFSCSKKKNQSSENSTSQKSIDSVAEISGTTFLNNENNGEIIVENNEAEKTIDENSNENLMEETDSDEENQENLVDILELEENSQEPIQNEEEIVEKILLNSKSKLQMMQYEKELFIPNQQEENFVHINSDGTNVVRSFYDSGYKLIKNETWNIPSVEKAALISEEFYEFAEGSIYPNKKTTKKQNETTICKYDEKGNVIFAQIDFLHEDKSFIKEKTSWTYTSDGKIKTEETSEYIYNKKNPTELEKIFVKKHNYLYNKGDIPPNYEYFEDGILKVKTEYSKKGWYKKNIYFDDEYLVSTYFENNLRKKDVYFYKGSVLKEKIYE